MFGPEATHFSWTTMSWQQGVSWAANGFWTFVRTHCILREKKSTPWTHRKNMKVSWIEAFKLVCSSQAISNFWPSVFADVNLLSIRWQTVTLFLRWNDRSNVGTNLSKLPKSSGPGKWRKLTKKSLGATQTKMKLSTQYIKIDKNILSIFIIRRLPPTGNWTTGTIHYSIFFPCCNQFLSAPHAVDVARKSPGAQKPPGGHGLKNTEVMIHVMCIRQIIETIHGSLSHGHVTGDYTVELL